MQDKLGPSITYLQKLGPEHIEHVFAASRWIFEQDRDLAFDVSFFGFSSFYPPFNTAFIHRSSPLRMWSCPAKMLQTIWKRLIL